MRKKLLVFGSILMLIGSYILIGRLQESNFTLFNTVSASKIEQISMQMEEAERLPFTALLCNEIRVPLDDASKTFYVPLDMESERWEKMEFVSAQAEYRVFFEENVTQYDKKEAIANNQKFPIIVYDETSWATYYVVFTGLPIIDLSTEEGFMLEEIWGSATFYDTDFVLHGTMTSEYNGHIRGNTSRMFPKKGYKMNLTMKDAKGEDVQNKESLFGMRKDDDWILYALYNDDTKIRDALSIAVWDEFGAVVEGQSEKSYYGPRITYVELFADNAYHGLYALMEPVDAKQLDLSEEDYLYKRKNSGGVQYDTFLAATNPYDIVNGFEIKDGIMDEDAWEAMAELAWALHVPDDEFEEEILNIMDLDSAMRMWLFIQIITGHDQTAKNVFYVARATEDGYRFTFAPWDMDLTWGNVSVGEVNPHYTAFEYDTVDNKVLWKTASRLMDDNVLGMRDEMQKLYSSLRKDAISDEAIEEKIESLDHLVRNSGAYTRDEIRWPDAAHTESTELITKYALERLAFLDKALYNFSSFDD